MGRLGSVSLRVPCMVRNILPLRVTVTARRQPARSSPPGSRGNCAPACRTSATATNNCAATSDWSAGSAGCPGPASTSCRSSTTCGSPGTAAPSTTSPRAPSTTSSVNIYDRAEGAGLRIAVDTNPDLYDEAESPRSRRACSLCSGRPSPHPDRALGELRARESVPVLDGGPLPGPARPVLEPDRRPRRPARRMPSPSSTPGAASATPQLFGAARDLARRLAARRVGRATWWRWPCPAASTRHRHPRRAALRCRLLPPRPDRAPAARRTRCWTTPGPHSS